MAYNFHKYGTNRVDSRGVSYDYDSVMHYSSTAFANRAGVRTIVGKNGRTNLGQRYGLSKKDIEQANLLYCGRQPPVTKPPPKPQTPPPPGGSVSQSVSLLVRLSFKVARNSFQHFPRRSVWWVIITTLYQSMLQSLKFCRWGSEPP